MSTTTQRIEGTPAECGAKVFELRVLPLLDSTNGRPISERAQFYAGLLGAAMGSAAADLGHANAVELVQALLAKFEALAADLGGAPTSH